MMKKNIILAVMVLMAVMLLAPAAAFADDEESVDWTDYKVPRGVRNTSMDVMSESSLTPVDDEWMRVFYDGENIGIEYYSNEFKLYKTGTLKLELPIWGGFYAGKDAYYIAEGQNNTEEDDAAEVFRIIKYDKDWNRLGAANITSGPDYYSKVRYPFDCGGGSMTEVNGKLYLVTGHEGYVDERYGQGHQGFLMIEVDEQNMTGEIIDSDLWHSFSQRIVADDTDLYVLEESEGSRFTKLSKYKAGSGDPETSLSVLNYGGSRDSAWAIATYATADGIAVSDEYVFCVGTSIDQDQYDSATSKTPFNVYLTVTPKNDLDTDAKEVKWLTEYTDCAKSFYGVHITKVSNDRFMISWEEWDGETDETTEPSELSDPGDLLSGSTLHYIFIDRNGEKVSQEYTTHAAISDCEPAVKNGSIVYYASTENMVDLYQIDSQAGELTKKVYRTAGPDATWDYENGLLTVSGKGPVTVTSSSYARYPMKTSPGGSTIKYTDTWGPARKNAEQLNVESGISSIPERGFAEFPKLKAVTLGQGLESIGKEAFYGCLALRTVSIPSTVTDIGDDIVWTGYYWQAEGHPHVNYAEIQSPCNAYAIKYADQNKIDYVEEHKWGEWKMTDDKEHQRVCTLDTSHVEKEDHDWDEGVETAAATDTDAGEKTFTCSVCGGKRKEVIPALHDIAGSDVQMYTSYYYTGSEITPSLTVTKSGIQLVKGTDYVLECSNNKEIGTAEVTIKGAGDYFGEIKRTFEIRKGYQTITYRLDQNPIEVGGTAKFTASALEDAEITYTSEDETIATVDKDGTVHAVSAGETYVYIKASETAHYKGSEYRIYIKTSEDIHTMEDVEIQNATETSNIAKVKRKCKVCGKEETVDFTTPDSFTVTYWWGNVGSGNPGSEQYCGREYDVEMRAATPENCDNREIVLESSDESIMKIGYGDEAGSSITTPATTPSGSNRIRFLKPGKVTLIIYAKYRPSVKVEKTFTVYHDWGEWISVDDSEHQRVCAFDESHVEKQPHNWDNGTVTKEATETEEGEKELTCKDCGAKKTETIPKIDPTKPVDPTKPDDPDDPDDPAKQMGEDGTPIGPGASIEAAEAAITGMKDDSDPAGSRMYPMLLKSPKQTKTSITLKWARPYGARKFVLFGNKCGKKNKMKKIGTYTKTYVTLKKAVKKIAKGKYYKFIIVSLDKHNNVVSTSNVIHVATPGGKVGNFRAVITKAKKNKVTLTPGKTFKLAGKGDPASRKPVKIHVGIRYQSADTSIATVSKKGVIKAKATGTTYVYACSQSGTFAMIKVIVK